MAKGLILASVCAAAVAVPMQIAAQTVDADSVTTSDIIVTASRRASVDTDVPASITTVSGDDLARSGIRQVMDLDSSVPGLRMSKIGGSTIPSIRGVSTEVAGLGSDANVAIYVDGIYQPLTQGNDFRFMDLERVEVLKGAQGALYGRNATGGAILFVTRDPSLVATSGEIIAGYGSYSDRSMRARFNAPLTDTLAFSISGSLGASDGYTKDLVRGGKANPTRSRQIRGKLLWEPRDRLKFVLTGEYGYLRDPTSFAGLALEGNAVGVSGPGPIATEPHTSAMNVEVFSKVERFGGSLRIEGDLDFAKLTSSTAYFEYDIPYAVDADYTPAPIAAYFSDLNNTQAIQQEFVLTSLGESRFSWLLGANAYSNRSDSSLVIPFGGAALISRNLLKVEAASVFAEGTYDITPSLTAILGLRYSSEKHSLNADRGFGLSDTAPLPFRGRKTWSESTPSLALRYALNDRTNIYATYTKGFKSGLFDGASFRPIDPENIDSYEIGIKSTSLRDVRFSLAGFYYDYRNQQVQSYVTIGGAPQSILQNAGRSKIYGLDAEADAQLTPEFKVSAGLSVLHARFESFPNAIVNVPTGAGGNVTQVIDASDKVLPRSPDWTLSVKAEYTRELSIGEVSLQGSVFHSDKLFFEYGNRVVQPDYTTVDASLSFRPQGTGFKISAFGRNLTKSDYIASSFITQTVDGVTYAPPRQFGIEAGYSF